MQHLLRGCFYAVMFEGVQRCPTPELQGADGSNSLPHAAQILPGLLQKPGLFSCASTTFPYAKPQHLEKRPINTKNIEDHMSSKRAPVIEAVCSPSHRSQRSFTRGPSLAPAWQGLSIIPQIAVRFLGKLHSLLLFSLLLPHSSPFHPLWLLHLEPFPLPPCPAGDATI